MDGTVISMAGSHCESFIQMRMILEGIRVSTIQSSDPGLEKFILSYMHGGINHDFLEGKEEIFWCVGIGYMEGEAWVQHYIKSNAKSPDEGYKVTFEPARYVYEKESE